LRIVFGKYLNTLDVMLVLSRKVGEKILIGDNISVTVVRVAQGIVRIGVEAPQNLPVVREEIKHQMREHTDKKDAKAAHLI
jgi:carbon storage regulator